MAVLSANFGHKYYWCGYWYRGNHVAQPKATYQFEDMQAWLEYTTLPVHSSSSAEQAEKNSHTITHHTRSIYAHKCATEGTPTRAFNSNGGG